MKKITILAFICLTAGLSAQSFSIYKTNNAGVNTVTVTNGGNLTEATVAGGNTNTKIKIKNNAANTQTFSVLRSVVFNSPTLILDGSSTTPNTYFCFGYSCFASNVNSPTPSDYTILAASGQTSTTFPYADNSFANSQPFSLYLAEGTNVGNYVIRYKVFNISNANDTLAFTVSYNPGVGIKEHNGNVQMISGVYPNPASTEAILSVNSTRNQTGSVTIYNAIGQRVKTITVNLESGSNELKINTSELNAGVYNVTLNSSEGLSSKKLIVSK
ncbi:MAG: T9SS type A sorting domain-containing protein [Bacteroidetes bacterium]|nr:T9SS type A sorting domain-containing protein [Bacteroidota bacterium]